MRGNELLEKLNYLDTDLITAAGEKPKQESKPWLKWIVAAACLALVTAICTPMLKQNQPAILENSQISGQQSDTLVPTDTTISDPTHATQEINIVVNKMDNYVTADMCVFFGRIDVTSQDDLDEFEAFIGICYDSFAEKIPDDYVLQLASSCSGGKMQKSGTIVPGELLSYQFIYETESGGRADIALSPLSTPPRDCYLLCDNPDQSTINGVSLIIYGTEGTGNPSYMVQFHHEGIYYDVETSGITLAELKILLLNLTSIRIISPQIDLND